MDPQTDNSSVDASKGGAVGTSPGKQETPGSGGVLKHTIEQAEAAAGVEPWATIKLAQIGANHDYIYNHEPQWMPESARGLDADMLAPFAGAWGLSFDGAVTLYQLLLKEAENGNEIDFSGAAAQSNAVVNRIIKNTNIDPEFVWTFYTNLDYIGRHKASSAWWRPSLRKLLAPAPEVSDEMPWWVWAVIIVGGVVVVRAIQKDI